MRVGIVGNYGHNNNGDEAILTGILEQLKKHLKIEEKDIVIFTNNVENTTNRYLIKSYPLMYKKGNIFSTGVTTIKNHSKLLKDIDLLIIGGGGLLMDMYKRDAPLYGTLGLLGKFKKCKVVIYGVGAGPINTTLGKTIIRTLVNKADSASVRDENSKKLLESLGINKSIEVIGDPAFFVSDPKSIKRGNVITNIGVTAVPYFSNNYWPTADPKKYHSYVNGLAKNLDEIAKKMDINITFYSTKFPEDIQVTKDIFNLMKNKKNVQINEQNLTPKEIFSLSSEQDVIIGTRLHSLILASSAQTPIIGIGYHQKVEDFMKVINQHSSYLKINELDTDSNLLVNLLNSMQNNWNDVQDNYISISHSLREEAAKGIKQLSAFIK